MADVIQIHAVLKVNDVKKFVHLYEDFEKETKKESGCIFYSLNQGEKKDEVTFSIK